MPRISPVTVRVFTAAAASLAGVLLSPAVWAQSPAPTPPSMSQPGGADISEQKLDAAAAAIQKVASVKQDYQQKIADAPPQDKERIASEAEGAMTKAVTDQGITVEEYSTILTVAQNDPQVREKILRRLRPQ
jgi:hypothetical protein